MALLRFIILVTLLAACKPAAESDVKSFVSPNARWPDFQNITVCFTNPDDVAEEIRELLKAWVIEEYHQKTSVRFVGWIPCTEAILKNNVISILFKKDWDWPDDADPTGYGAGGSLIGPSSHPDCRLPQDARSQGTCDSMNIVVGKMGRLPVGKGRTITSNWLRGSVVHEFGHAIGLLHEHSRKDGNVCDDQRGQNTEAESDSQRYVGNYDPDSIMNYCIARGDGSQYLHLSAGDIAGIDYLYPRPLAEAPKEGYRIASLQTKRCLQSNGTNIELAQCSTDDNQIFLGVFNSDGTFFLQNKKSSKCVDTESMDNDAKIVEKDCGKTLSQRLYILPTFKEEKNYQLKFLFGENRCIGTEITARDLSSKVSAPKCSDETAFVMSGAL